MRVSLWLLVAVAMQLAAAAPPLRSASDDLITSLPGMNFTLPFKQYSGYLDAGDGINLHYWFAESQTDPKTSPVLLWLNGGPGCSSLDGMLNELGPVHISDDGATLYKNKYSWNNFASVLFLESPACVGFSYSNSGNCSASDDSTSLANYNAIKDFFGKFPAFRNNSFFVTGESYAGIYIPTLSVRIVENNASFPLNFRGFAVGNGLSSWNMNDDSLIFFANYHGLLGELLWDSLVDHCCDSDIPDPENCNFANNPLPSCQAKVSEAMNMISNTGLNIYNLYGDCVHPNTSNVFTRYHADLSLLHRNNPTLSNHIRVGLDPPCTDSTAMSKYLNSNDVRKALHIPDTVGEWSVCNDEVNFHFKSLYNNMEGQYKKLLAAKIRGLVYNGDVDMACNFIGDQWFVESLMLKVTSSNRPWYTDQQVGGFVKTFEGLDLLTVRGSGHMVPQDKPSPALHMIKSFVMGTAY